MVLRDKKSIEILVRELINQSSETEWLEYKANNKNPQTIGEYISALANSAALCQKPSAYMLWGIDDSSHTIIGSDFAPQKAKKGNEILENWLLRLLEPKIDFRFYECSFDSKDVVLLEIAAADKRPVAFGGVEYIRVGSTKKTLKDAAHKEAELWRVFDRTPFEKQIAAQGLGADEVLGMLEYTKYFELLALPLPSNKTEIIEYLCQDELIAKKDDGRFDITNLGAILFARDLRRFTHLARKEIRVIKYKDNLKIQTLKEQSYKGGYACEFERVVEFAQALLPENEVIGKAYRENVKMYPDICIRELVANAIIHQDFSQTGNCVMIEIYANRVEITNPGEPLVKPERFLDNPPRSRNERLASFMRRINICEERGSGIDKVVVATELFELPAPEFKSVDGYTVCVLYAHKELAEMNRDDKIRACYLHCCLKYIQNEYMTNSSLRERFKIDVKNASIASGIIKLALESNAIAIYDESVGTRARTYVPAWAK